MEKVPNSEILHSWVIQDALLWTKKTKIPKFKTEQSIIFHYIPLQYYQTNYAGPLHNQINRESINT